MQKLKVILWAVLFALGVVGAVLAYNELIPRVRPDIRLADGGVNIPSPDASADGTPEASPTSPPDSPPNRSGESPGEPSPQPEQERIKAPDFTVVDADGKDVKLSDMKGKPVVLNFWASWCPPCKAEMPEFDKVFGELGGDIVFMMVDMTDGERETAETGAEYVREQGFSFPVYFDTSQEAAYAYGVRSIPTTVFIDGEGYVVTGAEGQIDEGTLRTGIGMITEKD